MNLWLGSGASGCFEPQDVPARGFAIVNSAVSYVQLARELVAGFEPVPVPAPVPGGPDEVVHGELELEPGHGGELGPEHELGLEHELGPEHELEPAPAPEPEPAPAPAPEPAEPIGLVGAVASVEADTCALERDLELEDAAASHVAQQPAALHQPVGRLVQGKVSTEMHKPPGA